MRVVSRHVCTGLSRSQHVVGRATCDESVCPYPLEAELSRCMPYPFPCCDEVTGSCFEWDGMDPSKCPNLGLRFDTWDSAEKCAEACGK